MKKIGIVSAILYVKNDFWNILKHLLKNVGQTNIKTDTGDNVPFLNYE